MIAVTMKMKAIVTVASSLAFAVALSVALAMPAFASVVVTENFSDVEPGAWYVDHVQRAYDEGYITGYTDGSGEWGVGDGLTRAQLAAILARHAGVDTSSKADATGLSDLKAGGQWYTGACNWAVASGVISGHIDSAGRAVRFDPNGSVTREQAATILARYAAKCGVDTAASLAALDAFPDKGMIAGWADDSVAWAVSQGIMSGYSSGANKGCFGPKNALLREQAAKVVNLTIDAIEAAAEPETWWDLAEGRRSYALGKIVEPGKENYTGNFGKSGVSGTYLHTRLIESIDPDVARGLDPFDLGSGLYTTVTKGNGSLGLSVSWQPWLADGELIVDQTDNGTADASAVARGIVLTSKLNSGFTPTEDFNKPLYLSSTATWNQEARTFTVTFEPTEAMRELGYYGVYVGETEPVPCTSMIRYAFVGCGHCQAAVRDEDGNTRATYLSNDLATPLGDAYELGKSAANLVWADTLTAEGASAYGELDPYVEGRTVREIEAEAQADPDRWRSQLYWNNVSCALCSSSRILKYGSSNLSAWYDCVLTAPWKVADLELRCANSRCEHYGEIVDTIVTKQYSLASYSYVYAVGH